MVKAGKECKGFSPDDEAGLSEKPEVYPQERLDMFARLLQAVYRGWKDRKAWRERRLSAAVPATPTDESEPETYILPGVENTRDSALEYVLDHKLLGLFKNLLSRLFYIKPENVRHFLLEELLKIQNERSPPDPVAAEMSTSSPSPESLQTYRPPRTKKDLGIFVEHDFPVYYNLLVGNKEGSVTARQLLQSLQRFSCKIEAEKTLTKNEVQPRDTVDEKAFCRILEEAVADYYDISQWTQ